MPPGGRALRQGLQEAWESAVKEEVGCKAFTHGFLVLWLPGLAPLPSADLCIMAVPGLPPGILITHLHRVARGC